MTPSAKSPPASNTARPASTAGRSTRTLALSTKRRIAVAIAPASSPYPRASTQTNSQRGRKCHRNNFCATKHFCRQSRLIRIVGNSGADKDIRVGGDPQRRPAHPCAAVSAISSIDRGLNPRPRRQPMNASIDAGDLAARNSARPAGKKSTTTFSPGLTPRCWSTSLRSVTCPFAVIVSVVTIGPHASILKGGKAVSPYIQSVLAPSDPSSTRQPSPRRSPARNTLSTAHVPPLAAPSPSRCRAKPRCG
jgi:hypothetical protein